MHYTLYTYLPPGYLADDGCRHVRRLIGNLIEVSVHIRAHHPINLGRRISAYSHQNNFIHKLDPSNV